jgi:hypothetical protein
MTNDHDTPDGKPQSYGGWEHIRNDSAFKFGKNDTIKVTLNRLTKGNDSSYYYTIRENYIGKDGKSYPKPRVQEKWGKQIVALFFSIRADDKERLDNWKKIFDDIYIDSGELAEQLHDPEQEKLSDQPTEVGDALVTEDSEPF